MKGSSRSHWVHQEAKKLTRTGRPFSPESVSCRASKVVAVKSGAGCPRNSASLPTLGSSGLDAVWLEALAIRNDTEATANATTPPIQAAACQLNRRRTG